MSHLKINKRFRYIFFLRSPSLSFAHLCTLLSSPHHLEMNVWNQLSSLLFPPTCSTPLYPSASQKHLKASLGKVSPTVLAACCFSSWDPTLSFGTGKADVTHQNTFTVVSMGKWANGNMILIPWETAIMINAASAIYFNIWPRQHCWFLLAQCEI